MTSYTDFIEKACAQGQRMIEQDVPARQVLAFLTEVAETVSGPATVASILVLDEQGLLRNGASPRLPQDYLDAIDRIQPAPNLGTCAAAAATGAIVLTPSFLADEKWAELRHLPLSLGFAGAWSMPIKSGRDSRVLGTFGTYFREVRQPGAEEVAAVRSLAGLAALVLDRDGLQHD